MFRHAKSTDVTSNRDRFLATAHHEAGHAVFYMRHTRFVREIRIDPRDRREGAIAGGTLLASLEEQLAFKAGGKHWRDWKRRAFCRAAECLAGPLAELQAKGIPFPEDLCGEYWAEPYFAGDIHEAKWIVEKWYRTANGDEVDEMWVDAQLTAVESYVQASLRNGKIRKAIDRIVDLLDRNRGVVPGPQLTHGISLPRTYLQGRLFVIDD